MSSTVVQSSLAGVSTPTIQVMKITTAAAVDEQAVGKILSTFLRTMNIPFPYVQYDTEFHQACYNEALRLGFRSEDMLSPIFQKVYQSSVVAMITVYAHIEDKSTLYWICLYTACVFYFDDLCEKDASLVRDFNMLFIMRRPQRHHMLDRFAEMMLLVDQHFSSACANLIVSSTLDFFSALVLDVDFKGLPLNESATSYPRYFRTMMGNATAFALFGFPRSIPLEDYIQILPDLVNWVDDVNDTFSFYKEELVGEDTNHISLLSKMSGKPKIECLRHLAEGATERGQKMVKVVEGGNPAVLEVLRKAFFDGYIAFHAGSRRRYRLDDLQLV